MSIEMAQVSGRQATTSDQPSSAVTMMKEARAIPPRVHTGPVYARPPRRDSAGKTDDSNARIAKLEALLTLEADIRSARTLRELVFCIANETRKCAPSRQTYVLRCEKRSRHTLKIDTVSNLSSVDRNAPAVRWLESVFLNTLSRNQDDENGRFEPATFQIPEPETDNSSVFPFPFGLVVPLVDSSERVFAAVVLMNERAFDDGDLQIMRRMRDVYRHAWLALAPNPHNRFAWLFRKRFALVIASFIALALFIPVPLTTLAPVEVVARQPHIIAAPIDGVIENVSVEPNVLVEEGQELFSYVDTDLAARHVIAEQNRNVALARLLTAQQNSFGPSSGRRDLAVAKAELDLAEAELVHAAGQLAKTRVLAPKAGLVVFDRKTDWQRKPVTTGERVIEIADPSNIEYRVDLAVSDVIVLNQGARTKVFLDSNPLAPREARVTSANYRASMSAADQLVYKVYAAANGTDKHLPRIGARGTAQIYGERVSLGFYLFRRPLSAIRQWLGW